MTPIKVVVQADQHFSSQKLHVRAGELYDISCDGSQRWKDWFIKSSPEGFWNPLAIMVGLRVKNVNCFCLCACYNDDITTAFPIGTGKEVRMEQDGYLSFFANDSAKHYKNNRGQMEVLAIRKWPTTP